MSDNKRVNKPMLLGTAKAVLLAGLLATPATSTFAQEQNSARVLEEIIVSARKRDESLQDSPVVISAISKESIGTYAIESIEDIADFTPGLLNAQRENQVGAVLALRGVGTSANSPVIDQAVSLVVDDMQIGTLQIQRSAIIDMESVQVYKGPQALFFGKNSPGGVLAIRSADPTDEFEAHVKGGYEFEANEWFVQGMASGAISDTTSGRLVARYGESDGYFEVQDNPFATSLGNQGPESENTFVRGTLIFEPNDDLTVRTKLTYADRSAQAGFDIQRYICPLGGVPFGSLPFTCEANGTTQVGDIPQGAIDAFSTIGVDVKPDGRSDSEQFLATVGVDYALNDKLTLSSVTGYYDNTFTTSYSTVFGILPEFIVPAAELEFEQFTQEFRLASDYDGSLNFVAGLFYEDKQHVSENPVAGDLRVFAGLPFSAWIVLANTQFVQDTTAYSAFIDLTWDITDNLELSGGARYSYEEKDFNGIEGFIGQDSEDWNDLSPQVTLSWRPNDEWMFYGSYREGFKSGGFDGSFQFAPTTAIVTYDEEEVSGFEFGAKGTLLDNTLQVNAAVYSYEYTDLQLSNFNADTLSAVIFNAGEADIKGVELDFVWITPVEGLNARAAFAYNDSEINDVLSDCYGGQTIALGCNRNFAGGIFNSQDISGNPLTLAPEIVANIGISYEREVGGQGHTLAFSTDILFSDEHEPSYLYIPGTTQDSFTKVNAAIRLSSPDDIWSVALIGRNLGDENPVYSTSSPPGAPGFGTGTAGPALPADIIGTVGVGRTVSVEFEYNFR